MNEPNLTPNNENYPSLDYFAAPSQDTITPADKAELTPQVASNWAAYNQAYSVPTSNPMPQPSYQYYGFNPAHTNTYTQPTAQLAISSDGYAAPGQPLFTPYGYGYAYPPMYAMYAQPTFTNVASAPKANFGQRLVALIIDTLIVYGFVIFFQIGTLIVMGLLVSRYYTLQAWFYFIVQALLIMVLGAFDTIMLGRKGQTIGCKAVSMQFVNAKGQRPGYWRAFFRWLLLTISFGLAFFGTIYLIAWAGDELNPYRYTYYNASTQSSDGLELLFALLSFAAVGFFLVGRFWFLWDSNKQTLFDKIVGVYALNVNPFRY